MEKKLTCWNCKAATSVGSVCEKCGSIQPIPVDTDYFSIFGFPRKLSLEPESLESIFYTLSWSFHPDFFHGKTEKEKRVSLDNSSFLNRAYRTLIDPIERVEYLLGLENAPVDRNQADPPADLFEEIFEIQDTLEEFRKSQQNRTTHKNELERKLRDDKKRLEGERDDLEKQLKNHFSTWDKTMESGQGEESKNKKAQLLDLMREILSNRSYLNTIIRDLDKTLSS